MKGPCYHTACLKRFGFEHQGLGLEARAETVVPFTTAPLGVWPGEPHVSHNLDVGIVVVPDVPSQAQNTSGLV